jgi:hypothetical protein
VLDAFSLRHLVSQDPRIIIFLQRLSTVDRKSFFNNGGWSGVTAPALATIAHVLVRLHILDHFLDALAFPPQATLPMLRTIPYPYEFPERVRRVCLFHLLLHFLPDLSSRFSNPSTRGRVRSPSSNVSSISLYVVRRRSPRQSKPPPTAQNLCFPTMLLPRPLVPVTISTLCGEYSNTPPPTSSSPS